MPKTIKVNAQEQENLLIFLNRVTVTGFQESIEYMKLFKMIQDAEEETPNQEVDNG